MNIKLSDELLKIAYYSEGLDIDTERKAITITFRSRNGMSEVMNFMKADTSRVIGVIDGVSIIYFEVSHNFSTDVDENGIPMSSKCIIRYELGESRNLFRF
jgi:hypothetical protein